MMDPEAAANFDDVTWRLRYLNAPTAALVLARLLNIVNMNSPDADSNSGTEGFLTPESSTSSDSFHTSLLTPFSTSEHPANPEVVNATTSNVPVLQEDVAGTQEGTVNQDRRTRSMSFGIGEGSNEAEEVRGKGEKHVVKEQGRRHRGELIIEAQRDDIET
jgi:hypothetical protein